MVPEYLELALDVPDQLRGRDLLLGSLGGLGLGSRLRGKLLLKLRGGRKLQNALGSERLI